MLPIINCVLTETMVDLCFWTYWVPVIIELKLPVRTTSYLEKIQTFAHELDVDIDKQQLLNTTITTQSCNVVFVLCIQVFSLTLLKFLFKACICYLFSHQIIALMKNAFYFIQKARFVLQIFKLLWLFPSFPLSRFNRFKRTNESGIIYDV